MIFYLSIIDMFIIITTIITIIMVNNIIINRDWEYQVHEQSFKRQQNQVLVFTHQAFKQLFQQ